MTQNNQDKEFEFGDIEEDDAYCPDDPSLEDIDWDRVQKLQTLIDSLPENKEERKIAAYNLQAELSKDS